MIMIINTIMIMIILVRIRINTIMINICFFFLFSIIMTMIPGWVTRQCAEENLLPLQELWPLPIIHYLIQGLIIDNLND